MKKLLLLIALITSTMSFSQHIAEDIVDEFTDNRVILITGSKAEKWKPSDSFTKNVFRGEFFLSSNIYVTPEGTITNTLNIHMLTNFLVCLGDNKIIFLFENGEKTTLQQLSKLDCSRNQVVKYHLESTNLNMLKNLKIKAVRIYTRDGYMDYDVKEKMRPVIQKTFQMTYEKLKEV